MVKKFVCERCNKLFSKDTQLAQHKVKHAPQVSHVKKKKVVV